MLEHTISGNYVQDLTSIVIVRVRLELGLCLVFKKNYIYYSCTKSMGQMRRRTDSKVARSFKDG